MKVGESIICPHCGGDSFVALESVMDGFRKTGEIFKCALCGKKIADVIKEPENTSEKKDSDSAKALRNLLGEDKINHKNIFEGTEKRFCRDCAHRVSNAFRTRCSKHNSDVNPMDDCPDFKQRSATEK